jgi:hypothetical protein
VSVYVDERWQDGWLRANYDMNPQVSEHAFAQGLISARQYLAATRNAYRAELDELIVASVRETLTIDEAVCVIRSREAA